MLPDTGSLKSIQLKEIFWSLVRAIFKICILFHPNLSSFCVYVHRMWGKVGHHQSHGSGSTGTACASFLSRSLPNPGAISISFAVPFSVSNACATGSARGAVECHRGLENRGHARMAVVYRAEQRSSDLRQRPGKCSLFQNGQSNFAIARWIVVKVLYRRPHGIFQRPLVGDS